MPSLVNSDVTLFNNSSTHSKLHSVLPEIHTNRIMHILFGGLQYVDGYNMWYILLSSFLNQICIVLPWIQFGSRKDTRS